MKKPRNKTTRSHSTSIDAAAPFLRLARKSKDVTKISLGIIKVIKTTPRRRVKCALEAACLVLQIRGNRAIQEIRFFTNQHQQFRSEIEACARENGYEVSK